MNLNDYQKKARQTALYPRLVGYPIVGVMYAALGLNGEAGEVAEQIKKSWRNDMVLTKERIKKIRDELGDVLWYTAAVASELDLSLEDIAEHNVRKLEKRFENDEIKHE